MSSQNTKSSDYSAHISINTCEFACLFILRICDTEQKTTTIKRVSVASELITYNAKEYRIISTRLDTAEVGISIDLGDKYKK